MEVDDETYLRGTHVFLEAQAKAAVSTRNLQNAALWVGFRQEFHSAFLKKRPFKFDLTCCNHSIYKQLTPADDSTWANRVVLHCAEILKFCYGNDIQNLDRYARLCEYNDRWFEAKPPSFNPMYEEKPGSSGKDVFPRIWFLGDCHGICPTIVPALPMKLKCSVTAMQHWHLARIMLAAFDPNIPQIGTNQKRETTRQNVRSTRKFQYQLANKAKG